MNPLTDVNGVVDTGDDERRAGCLWIRRRRPRQPRRHACAHRRRVSHVRYPRPAQPAKPARDCLRVLRSAPRLGLHAGLASQARRRRRRSDVSAITVSSYPCSVLQMLSSSCYANMYGTRHHLYVCSLCM